MQSLNVILFRKHGGRFPNFVWDATTATSDVTLMY